MINIHLNGDMVRCPDIAEIKKRISETYDKDRRCKYGIHECYCERWNKYISEQIEIKMFSEYGRCIFAYNSSCPNHKKHVKTGNMQKSFKIDNVNYRKLTSSAHYLVKKSQFKTLFITLTFPQFKRKVNEKEFNQYFSKFIENLRSHYSAAGYVAVRERGDVNNRYHFHLLLSIPFISFITLNRIWCNTISDICVFSKCAVRTTKKTRFITNPGYALRYVCKYFAKSKGATSKTRVIFISNNLIREPRHFDNKNCEYYTPQDMFDDYKSIRVTKTSDFTTGYRITDAKEFDRFTERVLNKLFNLTKENNNLFCPGTG